MCELFSVSRSGYYHWLNKREQYQQVHAELDDKIRHSFEQSKGNYGSPRIAIELQRSAGKSISRSTIARRMKVLKIRVKRRKRYVITTQSKHDQPIAPNLLNRDFFAPVPGCKWVSDLTYFRIGRRWAYLTTILDLADRAVVGWTVSDNMTAHFTTIAALKQALNNRPIQRGLIFHSDRGVQYACSEFRQLLDQHQCRQSMSRKGDCWDNAVAESFFKTIKGECLSKYRFESLEHARKVVFNYIDGWYNTMRIHTALGGKAPAEMYRQMTKLNQSA